MSPYQLCTKCRVRVEQTCYTSKGQVQGLLVAIDGIHLNNVVSGSSLSLPGRRQPGHAPRCS